MRTEITTPGDARTIVIVGANLAGASAATQLRKDGFNGRIVLIGEEPSRPYERPPLSKEYLRGVADPAKVFVHPLAWYEENAVELLTSTRVVAIEPSTHEVVLDGGRRLTFDRLLLATGSEPRRLEVPGGDLAGIHYLRTIEDADAIRDAAGRARRAVVIGAGWVGTEVAASLRQLGLPVSLVAPASVPLERLLGPEVGGIFRDLHARNGMVLHPNQRAAAFTGTTSVESVETDDGTQIEGDLVVVGVGAIPRTRIAAEAGLDIGDGILVNERLETSEPGIYAVGDVASAWHPLLETRIRAEHWDNARRQARAAARTMLGGVDSYVRIPYFYSDQYDFSMEYAGYAPTWDRVVFRGDPASGAFVAFWLEGGRLVAGMNVNVGRVNDAISSLVASRRGVVVERLIDPTIALSDTEAILVPGASPD